MNSYTSKWDSLISSVCGFWQAKNKAHHSFRNIMQYYIYGILYFYFIYQFHMPVVQNVHFYAKIRVYKANPMPWPWKHHLMLELTQ